MLKIVRKYCRNRNELQVPTDALDAASIAASDEPYLDYRKKIKYGNRIQVKIKLLLLQISRHCFRSHFWSFKF